MSNTFFEYERPSVTADVVLFRIKETPISNRQTAKKELQVLLMKRNTAPCNNQWSIPGGFVNIDETIEDTAKAKMLEKCGYKDFYMEQLYTFDAPQRDERWRVISTAYIGIAKKNHNAIQEGIMENDWFTIIGSELHKNDSDEIIYFSDLAFDHANIIQTAIERIKNKIFYSDIGFEFEDAEFTIPSLRTTFETILEKKIDNFQRIMIGRLEKTGNMVTGKAHRPAELYRKRLRK